MVLFLFVKIRAVRKKVVLYSTVTSQKKVGRKQRCPPKVEFGPDR
jgi:hypothetical protein